MSERGGSVLNSDGALRLASLRRRLSRLTERYTAAKIVAAALTMLPTLTNRTCMAAGESGDLPPDAAKLVWDALLRGQELVPGGFADDRIINVWSRGRVRR